MQVTDVKPLITVACYLDEQAGMEVYQEVTGESSSLGGLGSLGGDGDGVHLLPGHAGVPGGHG